MSGQNNRPKRLGTGAVLQASVPKGAPLPMHTPHGLIVRGVVVATYVVDDPNHPYAGTAEDAPKAVYCDLICYSSRPGLRYFPLATVLVAQRMGLHDGHVWKPKATTMDVTGNPLDTDVGGTPPEHMNGDHVLVGFLDDAFNQPVIIGQVPHPKADLGNEESGKQLKLKLEDGDPNFIRHHGTLYGVADNGDFIVDTRTANDGTLDGDGKEPAAPSDGKGSVRFRLPDGATFEIEVDGDASKHVALAEYLEQLYNNLKTYIQSATVPTGMGPSGTIQTGSGPAPNWDSKIESTKVAIPDES